MKREVRIINGTCKVVNIDKNGNILKIVGNYQKPKIDECRIREYEEYEARRFEIESECAKQEKETDEYKENILPIIENEKIHEVHYGRRRRYQGDCVEIKELDLSRKSTLQNKVDLGIIDSAVFNTKSNKELLDDWARKRFFFDYEEYLNIIALGRGFTCYREYGKIWSYYPGMPSPIKENRMDTRFLGVYIAENGINKIYEGSERMEMNNKGYDIICPKGYKIDVKAAILNRYNIFNFAINKNKIADYFVLVGFNNIIELKPLRIWVVECNDNIYGHPIKELSRLIILNEPLHIYRYQKYEKLDKLNMLKNICKEFDAKNRIEIKDYSVTTRHVILDIITQIRSEIRGNILPTDILSILEKKKKETINDRLKIISDDDDIISIGH